MAILKAAAAKKYPREAANQIAEFSANDAPRKHSDSDMRVRSSRCFYCSSSQIDILLPSNGALIVVCLVLAILLHGRLPSWTSSSAVGGRTRSTEANTMLLCTSAIKSSLCQVWLVKTATFSSNNQQIAMRMPSGWPKFILETTITPEPCPFYLGKT